MRRFTSTVKSSPDAVEEITLLRQRFSLFHDILERNNSILAVISDMEEKVQGDYLFDITYIRSQIEKIVKQVDATIDQMILLGGDQYTPLREKSCSILREVTAMLPGGGSIPFDDLIVNFRLLGSDRAMSVGSKNAQLGELKRLGLPVPPGFAITAWAYKRFLEANRIQNQISELIRTINIQRYDDLENVSSAIRKIILESPIPDDLAEEIRLAIDRLVDESGTTRFALRSSAIGEDTQFSFAGQYDSFLDVPLADVFESYKRVLAGKFTPRAIYYFLSHSLDEAELAMSVGCMAMVDAQASGVVYSRDPVNSGESCVLVHAIYGLGSFLVDGTLTPDIYKICPQKGIIERNVVSKPIRLVLDADQGLRESPVPESQRKAPAVNDNLLLNLLSIARTLESHYGGPMDIEWAVDKSGNLQLLQARPLQMMCAVPAVQAPDMHLATHLLEGGTLVFPGAGCGTIVQAATQLDLPDVVEGSVLVAETPFPELVAVMGKIRALVTEIGSSASHLATVARENRVPCLIGLEGAVSALKPGMQVTVDATEKVVYDGIYLDLVESRRPEYDYYENLAIFELLKRVLARIAPLTLFHPADSNFTVTGCRTWHDLTRFCHQRAIEEMFLSADDLHHHLQLGKRLKTTFPLPVFILNLGEGDNVSGPEGLIDENAIPSTPLRAFWEGVRAQGWPGKPPENPSDKSTSRGLDIHDDEVRQREFAQASFAVLSGDYALISLRLGYHFTTIESYCSDDNRKNFIRMQYKGGGAGEDRRARRIRLIVDILTPIGFDTQGSADFLDARLADRSKETIQTSLATLGRLSMLTKQLDMALSNDRITRWYTSDFQKKLGLPTRSDA